MGKTRQSNAQRIIGKFFGTHICKNLPTEIYRKLKNFCGKTKLTSTKKRFNIREFKDFILYSGLADEDYEKIFDLETIYKDIDKSNKIGKSKHIQSMSEIEKAFLIELNKKVQKILYRSVKRIVFRVLEGGEDEKIGSYMDNQCNIELHNIDLDHQSNDALA